MTQAAPFYILQATERGTHREKNGGKTGQLELETAAMVKRNAPGKVCCRDSRRRQPAGNSDTIRAATMKRIHAQKAPKSGGNEAENFSAVHGTPPKTAGNIEISTVKTFPDVLEMRQINQEKKARSVPLHTQNPAGSGWGWPYMCRE